MTICRLAPWALAILVGSFVAPRAWAQPDSPRPRGFGSKISLAELAGQKAVQQELKLSPEQADRLKKLADEGRSARRELRDLSDDERRKKMQELSEASDKKVAEIINPEQLKRLKQIGLQVLGAQLGPVAPAFRNNAQVIATLKLTGEQKEKIATISRETEEMMIGLAQSTDPEAALKEYLRLRDLAQEKIIAELTTEQQAIWKDLIGEPFNGELDFGGVVGFGGRNRN